MEIILVWWEPSILFCRHNDKDGACERESKMDADSLTIMFCMGPLIFMSLFSAIAQRLSYQPDNTLE